MLAGSRPRSEAAEDVSRQKEGLFGVGSVSGKSAFFMDNFGFGRGFIRKKRNFVADVIFRTVRCVNCFSSCWPSRRACSFRRAATVRASGSRRPLRPSRRAICTPTSGSASVRAVVRGAASWGCGTGVAKLTAAFRTSDLSAGPHAVDYYVYRLRRLII